MSKTKDQLQAEIELYRKIEDERKANDSRYAIKLIETIVFTLMGVIGLAVIGALIRLVITQ